jgi:hypothetical protein
MVHTIPAGYGCSIVVHQYMMSGRQCRQIAARARTSLVFLLRRRVSSIAISISFRYNIRFDGPPPIRALGSHFQTRVHGRRKDRMCSFCSFSLHP